MVDMGIHDFDLARWLMSSAVDRVSAEGTVMACTELESDGDMSLAELRSPGRS